MKGLEHWKRDSEELSRLRASDNSTYASVVVKDTEMDKLEKEISLLKCRVESLQQAKEGLIAKLEGLPTIESTNGGDQKWRRTQAELTKITNDLETVRSTLEAERRSHSSCNEKSRRAQATLATIIKQLKTRNII